MSTRRNVRVGKSDNEFNIAHLFFAGIVTAAGAAVFWGIKELVTRSRRPAVDDEQGELEAMLLASEAAEIE